MRTDIHLFINDEEVEFSQDPKILLNYRITDTVNPTAVKNTFSKSITVEGTGNNNNIFSNIWNLEFNYTGIGFNPIIKTPFTLYVNGEVYESGYVKLDSVKKTGNKLEYTITLYGGLGQFFYTLSYTSGGEKLKLSDLTYTIDEQIPELDFTINKDSVWDAWQTLMGNPNAVYSESEVNRPSNYLYDRKWKLINFAPMSNGIPDGFSADKVIINKRDMPVDAFEYPTDGYGYVNGYFLGELNEELTEWETRDLRSYLQRPVINMRRIIEACCDPSNNGGYNVDLDSHFFNNDNPYWTSAWMTLPMVSEMELDAGQTETISGCTLNKVTRNNWQIVYPQPTMSKYSNLSLSIRPKFVYEGAAPTAEYLYNKTVYSSTGGITLQKNFVSAFYADNGLILQLIAYDAGNNIVGVSNAYLLANEEQRYDREPLSRLYDSKGANIVFLKGNWKRDTNGQYYFCDAKGEFKAINFSLNNNVEFDHLAIEMRTPCWNKMRLTGGGKEEHSDTDCTVIYLYKTLAYNSNRWHNAQTIWGDAYLGRVRGDYSFDVVSFSVKSTDYENFISNSFVSREKILSSDHTPCDYLLSYCKMFGLYFYKEPDENTIHIMDRDTFYKRNEIVDLSELIDYSKNIQITPQTAKSKYYAFELDNNTSDAGNVYEATYHRPYGEQTINTNYDFDSGKTQLYSGNVFKGGIMVLERDANFNNTIGLPNYMNNGVEYLYYKFNGEEYDTQSFNRPVSRSESRPINPDGLEYYDLFPKLQCHSENNSAEDGDGVLMFFLSSYPTGNADYWLTDDIGEMTVINDEEPCWMLTMSDKNISGATIAYQINYIPYFSRNITYGSNITHTWDFSGSQETFIPNTFNTMEMGIYDKCWKKYISDIYDVNARRLVCYVNIENRPYPGWLRHFYWFENCIWRLESITDWNAATLNTTKMEFIKVADIRNYALDRITNYGAIQIIMSQTSVPYTGGSLDGYVYMQDGGEWWFADVMYSLDENGNRTTYNTASLVSPVRGSGTSTAFVVNIPANTGASRLEWHLPLSKDVWEQYGDLVEAVFIQEADTAGVLSFNTKVFNVSNDGANISVRYTADNINQSSIGIEYDGTYMDASIDKTNKIVSITVSRNETEETKTMTLTIYGNDYQGNALSDTLTIYQANSYMNISPINVFIDYDYPSSRAVTIDSNIDNYNIEISDEQ